VSLEIKEVIVNVTLSESSPTDTSTGRRSWARKAALLSGVILFFVGYAFHPDLPPATADAISAAEGVRDQFIWSKLAVAAGGILMIPMLVVIRRHLITGRGRVLGIIGTLIGGVGLAFNSLSQAVHGYLLWWATAPGLDQAAAVDYVLAVETPNGLASLPVSYWSVPLFGLGILLFGIALWRAGTVPRWAGPAIIVMDVIAAAFGLGLPMLAAGALAVVAFGAAVASLPAPADMPT
jgi:hypothetical protein